MSRPSPFRRILARSGLRPSRITDRPFVSAGFAMAPCFVRDTLFLAQTANERHS